MAMNWLGPWKGGRKTVVNDEIIYYIERAAGGKRYCIRLKTGISEHDAETELDLWRRDPTKYQLEVAPPPILDAREIERYRAHLVERNLARDYIVGTLNYLGQWARALNGADLRTLKVRELKLLIAKKWAKRATRYRLVALKSFLGWLTREQVITRDQNIGPLLLVDIAAPAKISQTRGYAIEYVEAAYRAMPGPELVALGKHVEGDQFDTIRDWHVKPTAWQSYRDAMVIRCKTGMHHTEIQRIARGDVEITEVGDNGIAAVVRFLHKKKNAEHKVSVDDQTLCAMRRLIARGRAPSKNGLNKVNYRVAAAMAPNGVRSTKEQLREAAVFFEQLRHSFATWAVERGREVSVTGEGLSVHRVSRVLGHRSSSTTSRHYDTSVPAMIVLPIKLQHPDDPVIEVVKKQRGIYAVPDVAG